MSFTSLLRFKAQPGTPTRHIMLHSELKRGVLCIFSDGTAALGAGNGDSSASARDPQSLAASRTGVVAMLSIPILCALFAKKGEYRFRFLQKYAVFRSPAENIPGKEAEPKQKKWNQTKISQKFSRQQQRKKKIKDRQSPSELITAVPASHEISKPVHTKILLDRAAHRPPGC